MSIKILVIATLTLSLGAAPAAMAQAANGQRLGPVAMGQGQGGAKQQLNQQGQQSGGTVKQQDEQRNQQQAITQSRKIFREQIRNEDVYGHEMMTERELNRYRDRLNQAQSDREWAQIREQHEREMQERAQSRGLAFDPPIYGQHLMTARERERYVSRLQMATSEAQRNQVREEHRNMIRQRANEMGIYLPPEDN